MTIFCRSELTNKDKGNFTCYLPLSFEDKCPEHEQKTLLSETPHPCNTCIHTQRYTYLHMYICMHAFVILYRYVCILHTCIYMCNVYIYVVCCLIADIYTCMCM